MRREAPQTAGRALRSAPSHAFLNRTAESSSNFKLSSPVTVLTGASHSPGGQSTPPPAAAPLLGLICQPRLAISVRTVWPRCQYPLGPVSILGDTSKPTVIL